MNRSIAALLVLCVPTIPARLVVSKEFQWKASPPESQGFSSAKLDQLKENLAAKNTKAFLVIRHDTIVYEWYSDDHGPDTRHYTASMAKALVGGIALAVAIHDGRISLDDVAAKYVRQWRDDPEKSKITVRQLGSHTSGMEDAEADGLPHNELTGWKGDFWKRLDPPSDPFSISRDVTPLLFDPGAEFQYSNPGIGMLGYAVTAALRDAAEKDLRTVLRDRIMRPIGVSDSAWSVGYGRTFQVDSLPLVAPWGGGGYTARAAARVGRLMLREGNWEGRQLISPRAVRQTTGDAGLPNGNGIGWWTNGRRAFPKLPPNAFYAAGAGHQTLLVVPSLDLICVRNGGALEPRGSANYETARGPHLFDPLMDAVKTEIDKADSLSSTGHQRSTNISPYTRSPVIHNVQYDWSTYVKLAPGSDNWPITWADDDHQYTAWGDGGGFGGTNRIGRVSLGFARIEGDYPHFRAVNVWGGKDAENPARLPGKCYGMVSVGGALYAWIPTGIGIHHGMATMYKETRLYRSTDHAASWQPADWAFTRQDGLAVPTILNFGKDYAGARDSYVYHYFIQPRDHTRLTIHKPGNIHLARVAKNRMFERPAYELLAGTDDRGIPTWTSDIARRRPVFEDPSGVGWNVSVSYNSGLKRYILITEHDDGGEFPDSTHMGVLGMFDAPEPWGPWTTVEYHSQRDYFGLGHLPKPEGGITGKPGAFYANFSNKWTRGTDFVLVFTGGGRGKYLDSWNAVAGSFQLTDEPPYPASPVIQGVTWAPKNTIQRKAPGSDNWPLTWGDDDNMYTAYGDGWGFEPKVEKKLSMGFAKIERGPDQFRGANVRSASGETLGQGPNGKKGSGILMVDGMLYLWARNAGNSQLAWSSDRGKTWTWSPWRFTTSFGCPTFLNFGKNYFGARDNYVYIYSLDSDTAYDPADRMVMARVPTHRIKEREAYEFLERLNADGEPDWTSDIEHRGSVFTHLGRCYRSGVTYNAGLKRYLWCQVHPESDSSQGPRFQGGFGIYDAPEPWGPWTTVFFTNSWDVGPGETNSFPTKWMSADGKTMHLVFSGDDYFSVRQVTLSVREQK